MRSAPAYKTRPVRVETADSPPHFAGRNERSYRPQVLGARLRIASGGDQPLTDVSPPGRAGSERLFPYRCFPPAKPALTLPQANIFDRSGFATTAEAERVRIPEEEE
jgi:hypothetical protein